MKKTEFVLGAVSLFGAVTLVLFFIIGLFVGAFSRFSPVSESSIDLSQWFISFFLTFIFLFGGYLVYNKTRDTKSIYFFNSILLLFLGLILIILDLIDLFFFRSGLASVSQIYLMLSAIFFTMFVLSVIINGIYLMRFSQGT